MTEHAAGSTVPRRTLGLALRNARIKAGLKIKETAEILGSSTQTIWRIENGLVSTKAATVTVLCDAYEVPASLRDALLALAKESRARGWWHSYGDLVPTWFELYVGLEQTASRIRIFEPLLVPGLLQSADYMGCVIRADRPELDDDEITARIQLKQSRQQILTRTFPEPAQVDVIIAESVLDAEPDLAVMRAQIWNLLKATELACVCVKILPSAAGPHRASVAGSFTLLEFPAENGNTPASTVYSENLTGAIYLDKPSEVDAYDDAWHALDTAALDQKASIALMSHKLKELNDREP